jgi:hypothetical protein
MTVPPKDTSAKQTIALVDDDRNILTRDDAGQEASRCAPIPPARCRG